MKCVLITLYIILLKSSSLYGRSLTRNILQFKQKIKQSILSFCFLTNSVGFSPNSIKAEIDPIYLNKVVDSVDSNQVGAPSDSDIENVRKAYRDFDSKRFEDSDKEFTIAISKWKILKRPRDEIVSLLKARGSVRMDNKNFQGSLTDYNGAIELMSVDGELEDGTARYPEYPDTFVGRALTYEGLADWEGALKDYNKAISLWGGGRGDGVNPFVLTFRGNTLCKLGRYEESIDDYEAASNLFNENRDVARYSDARANQALALYQIGRKNEAVKYMKDVIRKNPGYADMHVALAADSWSCGDYIQALKEWNFACNEISVGCSKYSDSEWLATVRRWPPALITKLEQFLKREIPESIRGVPGTVLSPAVKIN